MAIVCGMTRVGVVWCVVDSPFFLHALHTSLHRQYILLHFLVNTTVCSVKTDNLSAATRVNGFFCLNTKLNTKLCSKVFCLSNVLFGKIFLVDLCIIKKL